MAERQGLSCTGVVQIYETEHSRVQALRGLDLVAVGGSITVIVGPSGSGKSSLLRILAGIDQPTAGEVRLDGRAIESLSARRRRMMRRSEIGFVQQRPSENLTPGLSLLDQVEAAARWRGSRSDIRSLFDSLGISDLSQHKPDQLSGGEQQRGGIARAVVGSPSVLLADEPTAELDLESTRTVCALLRRLAVESGSVVLISTHDPEVVSIGDHVLAMRDGAVQSETIDGREVGVIDGTGRIQLPPETLDWFSNRRASVEVDPETHTIRIEPT